MFDAITAQPAAIAEVVARNREGVAALARALKETPALTLAGLGTSLNGAMYGEYWLRTVGRIGAVAFWQTEVGTAGKVGTRLFTIVMFNETGAAQEPADGVNV